MSWNARRAIFVAGLVTGVAVARSARAADYVVTTLADPGRSGKLSLREAIDAANARPGPDRITFAVSGTITPRSAGLPELRGDLTITGPLSSSGKPAVIIDGAQLPKSTDEDPELFGDHPSGLRVSGDRITIANLEIRNCEIDVRVAAFDRSIAGVVLRGNKLLDAVNGVRVEVRADNLAISDVLIADNEVVRATEAIVVVAQAASRGRLSHIHVTGNTVRDGKFTGRPDGLTIVGVVAGSVGGAARNRLEDIEVSGNHVEDAFVGLRGIGGGFFGADDNLLEMTFRGNHVVGAAAAIEISGSLLFSDGNTVRTRIEGNVADGGDYAVILQGAANSGSGGDVTAALAANDFRGQAYVGVIALGGDTDSHDSLVDVTSTGDSIAGTRLFALEVLGGFGDADNLATGNHVRFVLDGGSFTGYGETGIVVRGGYSFDDSAQPDNSVDMTIRGEPLVCGAPGSIEPILVSGDASSPVAYALEGDLAECPAPARRR